MIKHCSLTKLNLISYCGTFSYSSMVKNGLSKRVTSITRQQCDELHHSQTFNYNDFLIIEIPLNNTKTVEIKEMGSIEFEGNYDGASFSNEQDTNQNSIMITSLTITLEDYENICSLREQNVIFKDGSGVSSSSGALVEVFQPG